MTYPVALGLDTQPTRIGVALVTLDDQRPLWADTFPLVRPTMTRAAAVRHAIRRASMESERRGGEVVRVGIERAVVHGPHSSLDVLWDSGGTYALAIDACERVWKGTRLRIVALRPRQWLVVARGQGHGNDSKDQTATWVRGLARAAGWDEVAMNGLAMKDATDAVGIAIAACT